MTSALIATLMLAAPVYAQPGSVRHPGRAAPRDPPPRFTIAPHRGAPGPIGLPLPQIGLRPPNAGGPAPTAPLTRRSFTLADDDVLRAAAVPRPASRRPVEAPAPGRLILDVEPAAAQVFADGYYVGVPEDFSAGAGGGLPRGRPRTASTSARPATNR